MAFWVDWALWQKMILVLACLTVIVLTSAFSVLIYNRRRTKKIAEAEAEWEVEQNWLSRTGTNDIPFGALALQKGIDIEGIWISNDNTPYPSPCRSATPVESRPQSIISSRTTLENEMRMSDIRQHGQACLPASNVDVPRSPHVSRVISETSAGKYRPQNNKVNLPRNFSRLSRHPVLRRDDVEVAHGSGLHKTSSNPGFHRSSDLGRGHENIQRPRPARATSRRKCQRSSEEFRRVISEIFEENCQLDASESLQLNIISPRRYF